jgi:lysophospholipase L1-like esterase
MSGSGNLGVLAFGDSITNGGGELQWGVALQSWAQWLARGLGLPLTNYAVDGANVEGVVHDQQQAFFDRGGQPPDARYDVGCLYIGVNDVRGYDWDARAFEPLYRRALGFLTERCDRVVTATAPFDLGRPRAGDRKVGELNEVIRRVAAEQGALVVALDDVKARNRVMADRVHPTAFGQMAIAERALDVLAADGLPPKVRPSTLINYETRWHRRLRGDLTYVYRYAKNGFRAAIMRL